jgi:hypothetical protein
VKMHVIGLEVAQGVGKKSGNSYAIGKVHVTLPISQKTNETSFARGGMGATFQCEPELLRPLDSYPLPFTGEIEFAAVMRYGEVVQEIVAIKPADAANAPQQQVRKAA